jgi:glycosyltransferase involved in cell wall biosynthesis
MQQDVTLPRSEPFRQILPKPFTVTGRSEPEDLRAFNRPFFILTNLAYSSGSASGRLGTAGSEQNQIRRLRRMPIPEACCGTIGNAMTDRAPVNFPAGSSVFSDSPMTELLNEFRPSQTRHTSNLRQGQLELSIVMPCLNEADTVGVCILKAQAAIHQLNIDAEIIIADNGSSDGSQDIASELGARVITVEAKGYGNALMGGIEAARGRFVIMGDADDSYDFGEIGKFVQLLREGADLVQGCRLPKGGGTILPGAMPLLHRWPGNPMLTMLVRRLFHAPINDVYCGLRGFTKELFNELDLRCTGMEFATEMVIKTAKFGKTIRETPITLHPDGRKAHAPHLRTFRDGWRTLRFFLIYSPRWFYLIPGLILIVTGFLGYALALPGISVFGATLDIHTLLIASLALLLGAQSVQFGIFARNFAVSQGMLPRCDSADRLIRFANPERGLLFGGSGCIIGTVMLVTETYHWWQSGFGPLNYAETMRYVIPAVTLTALGYQTVISSFMCGLLSLARTSNRGLPAMPRPR